MERLLAVIVHEIQNDEDLVDISDAAAVEARTAVSLMCEFVVSVLLSC